MLRPFIHRHFDERRMGGKWLKSGISGIIITGNERNPEMCSLNADELNKLSKDEVIKVSIDRVSELEARVDKLTKQVEYMTEQIRLADANRFGRKTEKLDQIDGQLSLFNEAEVLADPALPEPEEDEALISVRKKKKSKQKGKREEDLKGLPHETCPHPLTDEELDAYFGRGNWKRMPSDRYTKVRCQPATFTAEDHVVDVAVGTGGLHQDEFLRGDRPKDLLKNSIATPSMVAAILNAKYVNAMPLYRIGKQFEMNGLNLSRQTMANWTISVSEKYLSPLWERLCEELLKNKEHVIQADETTCQTINDNDPEDPNDQKGSPGHKNYMWVYRTSEFNKDRPIVIYEYQRTRHHRHPQEFLNGFHGILETDGLQQYHMLENLNGLTNANCWVHGRRDLADALKAIDKNSRIDARQTIAYQALVRIAAMYKVENTLRDLSAEERLSERKKSIAPLVDEFFVWAKSRISDTSVLPQGKTAKGLNYCIDKEKYLRVFLTDGNVPMDNSASERAIRPFTIGRKNWVLMNSVKGAQSSAVIYSIVETAKLNSLNIFYYLDHLLTELPKLADEKGKIDPSGLDPLLPWSDQLPEKCHKPRR